MTAQIPAGTTTPCIVCGREMAGRRTARELGVAESAGHGRCTTCKSRAQRVPTCPITDTDDLSVDWVVCDRVMRHRDPGRRLTHGERLWVARELDRRGESLNVIAHACAGGQISAARKLVEQARERAIRCPVPVSPWRVMG